ncbi:branched-chain amino acid ABC transporter permease [Amycolatopsis jejuensis]|uniref:branched-chain amino acid ABC transporter permease n=1 Tax=Amycolatopsis jejuensis TaxID=330084 RepID=UPI000527EA92|nr:branched-chain amino acid ABC transporter permease [Amycolatopsis jejuensis]
MPLQLWVSVAALAVFSGVLGLGYLLVMRGSGVFMFALGPLAMTSAMLGSWLVTVYQLPKLLAFVIGVVAATALSALLEMSIVRPLHQRTGGAELPTVVAIVAVLFALQQLAGTVFGRTPLPGQALVPASSWRLGGLVLDGPLLLLIGVGLVLLVAAGYWLRRTRYGRMLRAVGDNERAAEIIGVPVRRIRLLAFALAGALAGVMGPLFAARTGVSFESGLQWTLAGFLALIVGGIGPYWAPLAGGLIIAALQTLAVYWLGPSWLDYLTFAMAFVFFVFRPQGLFRAKVRV